MKNTKKTPSLEQQLLTAWRELSADKKLFVLELTVFLKTAELEKQPVQIDKRQAGLGKGSAWISEDDTKAEAEQLD
jgi:hypothetical protein